MTRPIRIFSIQNLTDESLMFSFDGVDDHIPLPANGFVLLDVAANRGVAQEWSLAKGTRIYVKRIGVPTSGAVYVSTFYGAD